MRRRHPTIADIARRAGVSVGTVSNVFNGTGRFSDHTRSRVLQVAHELHYTPNALIRSLQRGKTHSIGVFTWMPNMQTCDIAMLLFNGIVTGIAARRYDTLFYSSYPNPHGDVPAISFMDGRVDGLILGPWGLEQGGLEILAASRLPVVALYQQPVPEALGAVNIDNMSGIMAAVGHLVALGHCRIAYCAPNIATDFEERRKGYECGLEDHGITPDPALCQFYDDYHMPPAEICDTLFALPDPPTAIIAGDDFTAFRLWEELERRGIQVPEDVSLVGFNDVPAASVPPGLTTVRQPVEQVGRMAADMLFRLMEGAPATDCRIVLPVELVVRGTTGPPRHRCDFYPKVGT
jgi:LacI family transcriptional regulator